MSNEFDADVVVGGWFDSVVAMVAKAGVNALVQTSEGPASLDAFKAAGAMILKARAGDALQQGKVAAVAFLADQGDPAAKQGNALLQLVNGLAKQVEGKSAVVGVEFDVEQDVTDGLAVDASYDWGW